MGQITERGSCGIITSFSLGNMFFKTSLTSCTDPAAAPLGTLIPYFPINSAPCRSKQSTNPNPSAPVSKTAPINPARHEKMGGQTVGSGSGGNLVLVDVEAAELLVLPSPGDGEGARCKLAERSANHGCGDLGGMLLRSGNPTSVEDASFDFWSFPLPFHSIFSLVSFLAEGTKGVRRRAAGCGPGPGPVHVETGCYVSSVNVGCMCPSLVKKRL